MIWFNIFLLLIGRVICLSCRQYDSNIFFSTFFGIFKIVKTFKFKLYNSKKNKLLHQQITLACQIYNHFIALYRRYYKITKKYPSLSKTQKHLTKLKKRKFHHWNQLGSQAAQNVVERIDRAYQRFFSEIKKGRKASPPKFKKLSLYKSFTLKQHGNGYEYLGENNVRIGKKTFRFFGYRKIKGTIKQLTIKRNPLGDIYIFFVCDDRDEKPKIAAMTGKSAGFDFGLKIFLTSSDGKEYSAPEPLKMKLKRLKVAHGKFSSKKKGSNNWKKAKDNLARIYRRITNIRNDYHWRLADELVKTYDELYFETLSFEGWKARYGRKTSDLAPASFLTKIKYKAKKTSKTFEQISMWEATTKTCSYCLFVNSDLKLSDREWACPNCQTHHLRDFNAAKNVLRVGTSTHKGVGNKAGPLTASNDDLRIPC